MLVRKSFISSSVSIVWLYIMVALLVSIPPLISRVDFGIVNSIATYLDPLAFSKVVVTVPREPVGEI